MIPWKKQGPAFVGDVVVLDGQRAKAVVLGAPHTPKGAVLVLPPQANEKPEAIPLGQALDGLPPQAVIEILCMQERAFGAYGLPKPQGID